MCGTLQNTHRPLLSETSNDCVKEEDGMTSIVNTNENCSESSNCAIKSGVWERRVEVGRFSKIKSINVFYYSEHFPTWLLLLDALSISTLTIVGTKDMEAFVVQTVSKSQCSEEFLDLIIDRIGRTKFRFSAAVDPDSNSNATLCLLSGSLLFISTYLQCKVPIRCLFFVATFS